MLGATALHPHNRGVMDDAAEALPHFFRTLSIVT